MTLKIFGMPLATCFQISKKNSFQGVFGFLTKESLIVSTLRQKILNKIKHSNGIKPPKNLLFQDFLLVSSSQRKFQWESVPSGHRSSTLYLKLISKITEQDKLVLRCTVQARHDSQRSKHTIQYEQYKTIPCTGQ